MTKIIERNRTRLVNIYLADLVRKTGSMSAVADETRRTADSKSL